VRHHENDVLVSLLESAAMEKLMVEARLFWPEAPDITTSYFQTNAMIPYFVVAAYFFLGKTILGQMTQTASAFGRVESALNFFIARYHSLASYKAVVERLTTFRSAIDEARRLGTKPPAYRTH
jgi:ABC-type uncharacterized transport system fused permease/ATPase subunit